MKSLMLAGYECITVMLPGIAITILMYLRRKKQNIPENRRCIVYMMIFFFYLFGVFYCTGAGTVFDAQRYGLDLKTCRLNLIPFSDTEMDYTGYGLNVVLFIPFGFLLPLIWPRFRRNINVLTAGALFSALIELSQLLNNRATDIDDLILNTAGAVLGAMVFKLFSRFGICKPLQNGNGSCEMLTCAAISFVCRFFFFNEMGMARILFGF